MDLWVRINNFSKKNHFSDLKKIERKMNSRDYKNLAAFIGDVTRIFENCRYFNHGGAGLAKSAENLEQFFVKQVGLVRERVGQ